jgi:hypothetical protein
LPALSRRSDWPVLGKPVAFALPDGGSRSGIDAGRDARAVDDRLVVAGEEAGGVAQLGDAHRTEIVLEELARPRFIERAGPHGAAAHRIEAGVHQSGLAGRMGGAGDRPAARRERRERGSMIVGAPAVDVAPCHRLDLRVADAQRAGNVGHRRGERMKLRVGAPLGDAVAMRGGGRRAGDGACRDCCDECKRPPRTR